MRESSSNLSKDIQKPKHIRGGDKKVMKKSLSVAVVVAMVSSMFASLAFADDAATTTAPLTAEQKYEALKKAGVLEGDDKGANLDGKTTRAQIAKILVKAFGLTEDASAASVYKDLDGATWASGFIGAVTKAGYMDGVDNGKFDPSSDVTLEQLATVLVRAFKLEHTSKEVGSAKVDNWAKEYVAAAVKAGLVSNKTDFTATALRSDLVYSAYVASQGKDVVALTATKWEIVDSKNVKVTFSDNATVTVALATALEAGKATQVTASYKNKEFYGEVTLPVVSAQDIKSAVALNSKVIEVALNTAATAVDASNFTVKDAAGTAVAVASAKVAPYSTDNKTVLVSLGADTTAGTLYTLTSGTKSVNFGGKGADTTKPTVTAITPIDYNMVDITFSEAVDISAAAITVAEKYGSQTALTVSATGYNGSTKVRLTTADQKGSTLYGLSISGVKDFAGNTMDSDTTQNFAGIAKSTDKQGVSTAAANDYNEVIVGFNVNLDPASLTAANFTINEAYGSATAVAVDSVRLATKNDTLGKGGAAVGDPAYKKYAIITTKDALKAGTLYKVTAANVGTLYGQPLDSAKVSTTFAGVDKPTSLTFNATPVATISNTKINVKFANKLDKATAETVANYAIAETYGNKAALSITGAALQSDNVTVQLTVASMTNGLYTLTVNNVKDIYGNSIKTDSSANVTSFAGAAVADKITSITSASLSSTDATQLTVVFNKNVGATATDVAHYSIDGSIGYPSKVAYDSAKPNQVVLTIPKTNNGQVYTLTVKGLENSDNVSMDSAGITGKFVGSGVTAGLPQLTAAVATDEQTVKLFFDRAVSDSTIKGASKIWNGNALVGAANSQVQYSANGLSTTTWTNLSGYAWQDPTNDHVLVVRTSGAPFNTVTNSNGTFTARIGDDSAAVIDKDKDTAVFAANNNDATKVGISAVTSLNNMSIRLFFNQPVDKASIVATLNEKNDNSGAVWNLDTANAIYADTTKQVVDVIVTKATDATARLAANTTYYLMATAANDITAGTSGVGLNDEKPTGLTGVLETRPVASNGVAPGAVSSVPVTMADARTLLVWFPEVMNKTTVLNATYYQVSASSDGSSPVAITSQISKIDYDNTTNKATITLNADLPASKYYLVFDRNIKNALSTKAVETTDSTPKAVVSQFAYNSTGGSKLTVSSATYSASNGQLTVKFNKNIDAATVNASDFTINVVKTGANGAKAALTAGTDFTIVAPTNATSSADSVVYGTQTTQVVIQLNVALDAAYAGDIEFASTSTLKGINGGSVDATVQGVFAQK
jgi:hypothetical protein